MFICQAMKTKSAMTVNIMEKTHVNILNMINTMKHADGLKEDKMIPEKYTNFSGFFSHNMYYKT